MDAVAIRTGEGWRAQFAVLQMLSVAVAVMGLSADSAAVVIGAMLLAPLMVPVLGIAASMAMALPTSLFRSIRVVIMASIGSIALAYVLAMLLPDGPLSGEVLSRTSPDLRDLVVALAAGAAGAYATVRKDVSASLPGVAVAVALVPPLATIGVTLQAGRRDLAEGALLLYAANLTAIVLIGVTVFLLTGFVPPRRFRQTRLHVSGGALVVAVATLAVAAPLTVASIAASQTGRDRELVNAAATSWIQTVGNDLDEVRIGDEVVRIRVSGPNPPPPTSELERAVRGILGPSVVVEVGWTQTQTPPRELEDDQPDRDELDAQRREDAVRAVVAAWLEDAAGTFDVERLTLGDDLRIDITSSDPPPPVDDLTERLRDEIGVSVPVVVNWTQRTTLRPGDGDDVEASVEAIRSDAERVTRRWARDLADLEVVAVRFDGTTVVIDLAGPDEVDPTGLEPLLAEVLPSGTDVRIWFSERRQLLPTTTTTTTTTTTAPTTAPPAPPPDPPGVGDVDAEAGSG